MANAFGVSPEMVQLSVQGGVDSQSLGSEQPADPLEWTMPAHRSFEPPLPPPPMPPGLGPSSSLVTSQGLSSSNQLLSLRGGPPSVAAQLFPTTSGVDRPSSVVSLDTGRSALTGLGLGRGLLRKAGAAFGGSLAADRIIHAIDGLRKVQDEDKTGTKGQVSSLKDGEKLDVFLAPKCGQLSVELCHGTYRKELFHSIKRAGLHAKHELGLIKWPVLITNRVALAIAGLWRGGSEWFTLQASDCATARVEQIEKWTPPTECKIEPRARSPSTFLTWLRYAENAIKIFGSAYGLEHVQERMKFLQALREAHEEDENAFPFTYCTQLFEEMTAVWCEEVREKRRGLCAKLGTENPCLEDLKLLALAPGTNGLPNFQFPRVWDLADSAGYYQKVVLPRQNKAMARLLNKQLHEHVTRERKPDHRKTAGPTETEGSGAPPHKSDKAGRAPRLALKTEVP